MDIVVQDGYVYGCYDTPANRWFILNTANGTVENGLDSEAYSTALRRLGLPVIYIGDQSVNILEIRSGFKNVYW